MIDGPSLFPAADRAGGFAAAVSAAGSAGRAGFASVTSGVEVTDIAGLRNGLSRSATALETARMEIAPRPMTSERTGGMKRRDGLGVRAIWPSGRSISLAMCVKQPTCGLETTPGLNQRA